MKSDEKLEKVINEFNDIVNYLNYFNNTDFSNRFLFHNTLDWVREAINHYTEKINELINDQRVFKLDTSVINSICDKIYIAYYIRPTPGIPHWGDTDFFNASMHLISSISHFDKDYDNVYKKISKNSLALAFLQMIREHYSRRLFDEDVCAQAIGSLFNESKYSNYKTFKDIKLSIQFGEKTYNYINTPYASIYFIQYLIRILNVNDVIKMAYYKNSPYSDTFKKIKTAIEKCNTQYFIIMINGALPLVDTINVNGYIQAACVYCIFEHDKEITPNYFDKNKHDYFHLQNKKICPKTNKLEYNKYLDTYYTRDDYKLFKISNNKLYCYSKVCKYLCYFPTHEIIMDFNNDPIINSVCGHDYSMQKNNDAIYGWIKVHMMNGISATLTDYIAIPQVLLYTKCPKHKAGS